MTDEKWKALSAPFPADQVEKLPKQMKRGDDDKGKCQQGTRYSADGHYCGGWHARSIHLDYVGHAGVTMRLNDVDPTWTWEPMALTAEGLPLLTADGLWIRLTVLGVTRLGFGDAGAKRGPDAIKELIGDGIRNAAMRFGVGTYLWSKSEYAANIHTASTPDADHPPQQAVALRPPADLDRARKAVWEASVAVHAGDSYQDRRSFITAALAARGIADDDAAGLNALAAEWGSSK